MGRNLDNISGKFLMYPRFIQVFLDKQLKGLSNHERKYVASSQTTKIFGNMRRIEKGFSGRMIPLFPTMVTQIHRKPRRKVTEVPQHSDSIENVADEAVYKELDDRLVKAAPTASSLEAEQDSGNINKTKSKATPNESSSQRTDSGGGLRCQESIGDTITQTRSERVSKLSNDSLLAREDGVTRLKKYFELSSAEAIQAHCDVKATNIILQALPSEIYALVSTHKVAKDLWERIQMLMQGTSLTKQAKRMQTL
nr:hypothetical protein [Tanacetum cinerariifolium]